MSKKNIITNNPFVFAAEDEYCLYRADLDFWWPYIANVLEQHHLADTAKRSIAVCGFNSTYPVFLIQDIVVKFFGHRPYWRNAFNTECAAHEYLLQDQTIQAPHILAKGQLFANTDNPWPYIISTKISGQSWLNTPLTHEEKNNIAMEIGQQLRKIHALPTDSRLKHDHEWSTLNFNSAVEKSILPKHLIPQVDSFIAKLDDFDRCFVNGDMVDMHVFVENGHLTGIIDWGDATITDRHYELGKLLDTFDWDKRLLRTVIDASNWPVKKNFSKQCLGLALYRQAVGLTQHNSFDVFYKLPDLLSLDDIATLDELADVLFKL
ncbi:Phosphotransferase enzyme family protein [Legionella santicrucis]|uniref:Phosphotransferase enzyme family protein n=1 Tax=Legionella santicrucis TaxID=45074 RepID=A0A0W0Y9D7_9GAMM|nr:phosphotransferase [Legionella santicrucis]KTD53450.1 Phosphotransferase enzyme family protein [Legionella santicrucis]